MTEKKKQSAEEIAEAVKRDEEAIEKRDEEVSVAAAKIVSGLRDLYRLYDGDGMAVGEVLYEADKAAARENAEQQVVEKPKRIKPVTTIKRKNE
jgi:hypothetical protein